jgi:hypothetical protein
MFHLCFRTHVASVFIWMLYMFHTYVACVFIWMLRVVAMVFKCISGFFQVFQNHVSSVSVVFRRMLQLLFLDVSKVDRVLHLFSPPSAASSLPKPTRHPYDSTAGSFQIGGVARPSPLVTWAVRTPHAARNERGAARCGRDA